jgi:hypothetical protein
VSLILLAADDTAQTAGAVVGRLLFPLIGMVLIVLGSRRRRDRSTSSRGTGLIVGGAVLLALGVLGVLAGLASSASSGA